MKNIYLTVLLLVCLVGQTFSQLRIAATGGFHTASVTEKNSLPGWETSIKPGYASRSGMQAGVLVEAPLSSSGRLFFNPGILYESKGRKFSLRNDTATAIATDTISASYNFAVNYISFPVNLTYKLPLSSKVNFLISAGPYIGFFYNGKQKSEARIYSSNKFRQDELPLESGNDPEKIKTVDIGLNARAGLEIGNVWITAYGSKGLTSFYTADYEGTFKHQVIGVSAAVWINKVKPKVKAPKDTDKDGVPDMMDACPTLAGLAITGGCPDKDGDGIGDNKDKCPDVAGTAQYEGCPVTDADNDGVNDDTDKCPTVPGPAKYKGCPIPDTDGDGLNDEVDSCPDKAGSVDFNGCPVPDSDGDGINDRLDKCPSEPGILSNSGCPEVKAKPTGIVEQVNYAARNIFFNTGANTISQKSYAALDQLIKLLGETPSIRLVIEGHTDATGRSSFNKALSQQRAEAVLQYLVSEGIDGSRLSAIGYGSEKPIDTNKTLKGQARNRRVEMKLVHF